MKSNSTQKKKVTLRRGIEIMLDFAGKDKTNKEKASFIGLWIRRYEKERYV